MGGLEGIKVLVTGATGFVGTNLVRRLVDEGARVSIISRSKTMLDAVRADLLDYGSLVQAMEKIEPEKVFHLGAFVDLNRDYQTATKCVQTNIQGTLNLLEASKGRELSSFVYLGTYEVYGFNPTPFDEEQPVNPVSPYSISKVSGEHLCKLYNNLYGLPVILLRLSHLYGPQQDPERLIPYVVRCALRNEEIKLTAGDQTRDYLFVEDAVKAILKSSISDRAVSGLFNIGSGREYSVREIVEKILELTDSDIVPGFGELQRRSYDPERLYCDISRAKEVLDWVPDHTLEEGLKKTIEWYKNAC